VDKTQLALLMSNYVNTIQLVLLLSDFAETMQLALLTEWLYRHYAISTLIKVTLQNDKWFTHAMKDSYYES
jgi:hypothetical protein